MCMQSEIARYPTPNCVHCLTNGSVQTPKVILSTVKGRLSHVCEEIVFSRYRASIAQSGTQMLDVAAIEAGVLKIPV
jgi:hypothetical protein